MDVFDPLPVILVYRLDQYHVSIGLVGAHLKSDLEACEASRPTDPLADFWETPSEACCQAFCEPHTRLFEIEVDLDYPGTDRDPDTTYVVIAVSFSDVDGPQIVAAHDDVAQNEYGTTPYPYTDAVVSEGLPVREFVVNIDPAALNAAFEPVKLNTVTVGYK